MHFNRPDVIFSEHDDNNTMSTVSLCRIKKDFRIDYMVKWMSSNFHFVAIEMNDKKFVFEHELL